MSNQSDGDEIFGGHVPAANDTQVAGDHYKSADGYQTWDYIQAHKLNYLAGNVIKYVTRYEKKNGVEDLKKAKHYLEKLIETAE